MLRSQVRALRSVGRFLFTPGISRKTCSRFFRVKNSYKWLPVRTYPAIRLERSRWRGAVDACRE
jgi:hypothetical protein